MFLGLTNKQAIIGGVVITLVVILSLFIFFRTRAAYKFPDTTAAAAGAGTVQRTAYDDYTSNLDTCTTIFAVEKLANNASADDNRNACIDKASLVYINLRCPQVGSGQHTTSGDPYKQWDLDKLSITKMYTRTLNDLNGRAGFQIGQSGCAYDGKTGGTGGTFTGFTNSTLYGTTGGCTTAGIGSSAASPLGLQTGNSAAANVYITSASTGAGVATLALTSTTAQIDEYENSVAAKAINLARNADIAAATRKYIATVCTDFYETDGTGGLSVSSGTKYQKLYFPDLPATVTGTTLTNAINAVTPYIKKWLPFWIQRAATFTIDTQNRVASNVATLDNFVAATGGSGGTVGSLGSTSAVQAMSAATAAGFTSKHALSASPTVTDPGGQSKAPMDDNTMNTQAMRNWQLARMYGPYSCWFYLDTGSAAGQSGHASTMTTARIYTAGTGTSGTGANAALATAGTYTDTTTNGTLQFATS